jgi:IS5 family transposase
MSKPKLSQKPQYRIKNWSEYDAALKQRGSLTFWFNEETLDEWLNKEKTGKKGASNRYSNVAIELMATVQSMFRLAGRQTEAFVESIFTLMAIKMPVPDHSTLSRRLGKLEINLPVIHTNEPIHLVVDSTGVKVYGEGEWKVRQHGVGKRRRWRKLHVGVNESTGEILSAVVSTNNVSDDEVFEDLLDGVDGNIEQVSGDGAYDKRKCYDAATTREVKPTIPPRKDAVIWQHGNCKACPHPRDENLRQIRKIGRKNWKSQSGYHRRSLSETTMFRLKTIFGGSLRRRKFDSQAVELLVQCTALNRMIQLGKPDSYKIDI